MTAQSGTDKKNKTYVDGNDGKHATVSELLQQWMAIHVFGKLKLKLTKSLAREDTTSVRAKAQIVLEGANPILASVRGFEHNGVDIRLHRLDKVLLGHGSRRLAA